VKSKQGAELPPPLTTA